MLLLTRLPTPPRTQVSGGRTARYRAAHRCASAGLFIPCCSASRGGRYHRWSSSSIALSGVRRGVWIRWQRPERPWRARSCWRGYNVTFVKRPGCEVDLVFDAIGRHMPELCSEALAPAPAAASGAERIRSPPRWLQSMALALLSPGAALGSQPCASPRVSVGSRSRRASRGQRRRSTLGGQLRAWRRGVRAISLGCVRWAVAQVAPWGVRHGRCR